MKVSIRSLSIGNFIGDLPSIVNGNFKALLDFLSDHFGSDPSSDSFGDELTAKKVTAEGQVRGNSGSFQTLYVNSANIADSITSLGRKDDDLEDRLAAAESEIAALAKRVSALEKNN